MMPFTSGLGRCAGGDHQVAAAARQADAHLEIGDFIGQVLSEVTLAVSQPAAAGNVGRYERIPVDQIGLALRISKRDRADVWRWLGVWQVQFVGNGKLRALTRR